MKVKLGRATASGKGSGSGGSGSGNHGAQVENRGHKGQVPKMVDGGNRKVQLAKYRRTELTEVVCR